MKVFATSFNAPSSCIGNNPRPLDGAIDVGACEVGSVVRGDFGIGGRRSAVGDRKVDDKIKNALMGKNSYYFKKL